MNLRQIALSLVLRELGLTSPLDTFDKRLILQKAIYLTQQSGISLGYHYYWYLYGPYSRDLTSDAHTALSKPPTGWSLDDGAKEKLKKIKAFFNKIKKQSKPAKGFELLASVLFSIVTGQANPADTTKIARLMKAAGKNFSRKEVDGAVKELYAQRLIREA